MFVKARAVAGRAKQGMAAGGNCRQTVFTVIKRSFQNARHVPIGGWHPFRICLRWDPASIVTPNGGAARVAPVPPPRNHAAAAGAGAGGVLATPICN